MSKHIFLGSERISTKVRELSDNPDYEQTNTTVEKDNIYYYHSDHLGSAQTVTNGKGELYERLEYTPYGEVWLDESAPYVEFAHLFETPYRFTAKELDEETGLYYYGARYLDPKYSRWISTDPALAEYIPSAPINDEAKKRNQNLPGMGGIFNTTNCGLYHYAANNPVRYTDPDGREVDVSENTEAQQQKILSDMQSLTNDELIIQNNKIVIKKENTGSKEIGTKLIRNLIQSDCCVNIKIGEKNKNATYRPKTSGIDGNGCDCSIVYDGESRLLPVFSGPKGMSLERVSSNIVLGHELIHAYHNFIGENKGNLLISVGTYGNRTDRHDVILTDGTKWTTNGKLEEYMTVFDPNISENSLRFENGLPKRGIY